MWRCRQATRLAAGLMLLMVQGTACQPAPPAAAPAAAPTTTSATGPPVVAAAKPLPAALNATPSPASTEPTPLAQPAAGPALDTANAFVADAAAARWGPLYDAMTPSAKHAALIEVLDLSRRLVLRRLIVHDPDAPALAAQWQSMIRSRGHRQLIDRSINRAVALRRITDQRATFVQFSGWLDDRFTSADAPKPVGVVASLDRADDVATGTLAAGEQVWPLRLVNWSGRWLIDVDDSAPVAALSAYLAATHGWSAD